MTDTMDLSEDTAAMIAAQAPRLFATVVTKSDGDSEIIGWGMEFDDSAYMITAGGRHQYFLAEAENALMYVGSDPDATAELVWVAPAVLVSRESGSRGRCPTGEANEP